MGGVSIACISRLVLESTGCGFGCTPGQASCGFCRDTAIEAADPSVWKHLADLAMDAGFAKRLPLKYLNALANNDARIGQRPAHLVGYLATSLGRQCSFARLGHCPGGWHAHGVESILGSNSSLYRSAVIPFISEFLDARAVKSQRFAFTTSDLIPAGIG